MYTYVLYKEFKECNWININNDISTTVECNFSDDININVNNNKEYVDLCVKEKHNEGSKVSIDNENDYIIDFIGKIDSKINVVLYVYTYNEYRQIYKETININTTKKLDKIDGAKYIKIVIRVYGNGSAKIKKIDIKSKKNIKYITNKEVFDMGYNKPKSINELKIACILDPFTMNCYEGMCELLKITPDNWKICFEINRPHLLLVESAWHGNNKTWENQIQCEKEHSRKSLIDIISWCNKNNVPTVFWNKEDPYHYNHFIKSVRLFDYIFTTDENCIEKYKKDLNNENVYVLPFAAQPKIHNPIKINDNRINKACFAGSFYNNKYIERKEGLERLLRVAKDIMGLDIYDRNYNNPNIQYKFPIEFKDNIKGYLNHNELDICNKGYKVMLNTNSIIDSKTMFSRRVFEGLACKTPVVSTYSRGIKNMFNDIVISSDDERELKEELLRLKEESYYDKKGLLGAREVMKYHTYQHRLRFILEKIGIEIQEYKKKVCILSKIENTEELKVIKTIYESQTYKSKELYIFTENMDVYEYTMKYDYKNIIIINDFNKNMIMNNVIRSDYIGIINSYNYYGGYYLEDMVNATLYTDAEFIGKKSYFRYEKVISEDKSNILLVNPNQEYQYVESLDLDRCIFKYKIIENKTISEVLYLINNNSIEGLKFGNRYLSIDKFNFIEGIKEYNINEKEVNECII